MNMPSVLPRPFQSNGPLPLCYCKRNGCYPLVCQWTQVQFCGELFFCPPLISSSPFPCLPSFFLFFSHSFSFFSSSCFLFSYPFCYFSYSLSSLLFSGFLPPFPLLSLSHCLCFCFVFLALKYLVSPLYQGGCYEHKG